MKNIIVLVFCSLFLKTISYGQTFTPSKTFTLTKYTAEEAEKSFTASDSLNNGYVDVFIKNKKGKQLQQIKVSVFVETYDNDGIVEEATDTHIKNVKKIIRLRISHCACYCNSDIYYWFITTRGEWIPLPTIEEESYELSLKTKDYVFSKVAPNHIELYEYQDKMIRKSKEEEPKFVRKSTKLIQTLIWDGKRISYK